MAAGRDNNHPKHERQWLRWPSAPSAIPKGLNHSAQGCPRRVTLGGRWIGASDIPSTGKRRHIVACLSPFGQCHRALVIPKNTLTDARTHVRRAWSHSLAHPQRDAWDPAGPQVKAGSEPLILTGRRGLQGLTSRWERGNLHIRMASNGNTENKDSDPALSRSELLIIPSCATTPHPQPKDRRMRKAAETPSKQRTIRDPPRTATGPLPDRFHTNKPATRAAPATTNLPERLEHPPSKRLSCQK